MRGSSARAREAVEPDTFARWATSLSRTRRRRPSPCRPCRRPPLDRVRDGGSAGLARSPSAARRLHADRTLICNRLRNRSTEASAASTSRPRVSPRADPRSTSRSPRADRERVGGLPVRRAVQLVVPPAVEARRADRVDPRPQRDLALARPDAPRPLVGRRRSRRPERVREVDPRDEPSIEAGRCRPGVVPRCHRCQKSRTRPTLSRSGRVDHLDGRGPAIRAASRRPARGSSGSRRLPRCRRPRARPRRVTRRSSVADRSGRPAVRAARCDRARSAAARSSRRYRRPGRVSASASLEHRGSLVRPPALDVGEGARG